MSCRRAGILYQKKTSAETDSLAGIVVEELKIPHGGITAILGPSGSGKSTLLSLIGGLKEVNAAGTEPGSSHVDLLTGSADEVQLLNRAVPAPGIVGYVFQESHLMKALSVGLNLQTGRALTMHAIGLEGFRALMKRFRFGKADQPGGAAGNANDIDEFRTLYNDRISNLSGGQQQRIAVGRAVQSNPRIILCDEPTSSLDADTADMIMSYFADWARENDGTVIWVTHDRNLALAKADRLIYVNAGQIVSNKGAPFELDPEMDLKARRSLFNEIQMVGRQFAPLKATNLQAAGIDFPLDAAGVQRAAEPRRKTLSTRRFNSFAILAFIWRFVLSELFYTERSSKAGRGCLRNVLSKIGSPLARFSKPTFALVICLGLVTIYAAIVGYDVLQRSFERSLSQPEVAQFTMEARSRADTTRDNPLSVGGLRDVSRTLEAAFASEISDGARSPETFGRRIDFFAEVARSADGTCDGAQVGRSSSPLLVFDEDEPLYAQHAFRTNATNMLIGDFSRRDLRQKAIVTPAFLRRVLSISEGDNIPDGFCFGSNPSAYVEIIGVTNRIPGSEDFPFEFAMTNDSWLRIMSVNPPSSWEGERPPFQTAALYFDASYADSLFCRFDQCADAPEFYDPRLGEVYKLDSDALNQIRKLFELANGAQSVLLGVLATMLFSVGIAIALSVSGFISTNERFLAIMRAVGYRLRHMTLLFLLEFLIITLIACAVFALVLILFHGLIAPELTATFDLGADWLDFDWTTFLRAVLITYTFVAGLGVAIMMLWWAKNRYAGAILQGL